MTDRGRAAAGLLNRAARLADAREFDKAIHSMDMALTEIQQAIFNLYRSNNDIEENR